ncbi:MAG: mechanosensitive ion channel family protein [Gemmatimonadaceae bacterium]
MTAHDWLYRSFYGNSLRDWTVAAASAAFTIALILGLRTFAVRRLGATAARTATLFDDALLEIARSVSTLFVVVIVACNAGLWLRFSPPIPRLLIITSTMFGVLQAARSGTRLVSWWLGHYSTLHGELDRTTLSALGIGAKILVWVALLLIGAENLGIKVTGLLTAAGIGGIAIALALQNILGDLFAALSIVIDKPFVVGESIAIDTFEGRVERVGLKSTRVRSVNGELVVFANADLLKSRLRNLSRRDSLRLVFTVTIDPATKSAQLARVPAIMAAVVGEDNRAVLGYSNLMGTGQRGFDVETAILIPRPYSQALDVRQAILLEFYARLEREQIALARPLTLAQ